VQAMTKSEFLKQYKGMLVGAVGSVPLFFFILKGSVPLFLKIVLLSIT
jgi:hypothetical protein